MAPESQGRAGYHGHNGLANGGTHMAPPPSTLAAQLVENISTSARSTRPDETQELKKLFSVIEKVKNQPDLLKTPEEQVKHNHMLIYVYCRVVLDGLKWDEPFANRIALKTEALKAINFLKVTIKETPTVLNCTTDGKTFLFRGQEPLWVWILPKVLKLLGHPQCPTLSPVIEEFCQFIMSVSGPFGASLPPYSLAIRYFQGIVNSVFGVCREISPSSRKVTLDLVLPTTSDLESLALGHSIAAFVGHTFQVAALSQAIQLVTSILTMLADTISSHKEAIPQLPAVEVVPWLLDSLLLMQETQRQWSSATDTSPFFALRCTLKLCSVYDNVPRVDTMVRSKIHIQLVLLCSRLLDQPTSAPSDDEGAISGRHTLSLTFIQLATAASNNKPIARLIRSQLLPPLERLGAENQALDSWSDFRICVDLLQKVVANATLATLQTHLDTVNLLDAELRQCLEPLRRSLPLEEQTQPRPKRRKLAQESSSLQPLLDRLSRQVNASPTNNITVIERALLNNFEDFSDSQRCAVIDIVASIVCASDDTLTSVNHAPEKGLRFCCSFCKSTDIKERPACLDTAAKARATTIFAKIIRLPCFIESKRPRVIAMIALRRFVLHSKDPEFLDLETSTPGQWCLQSLQSSLRELRIAAGRTLTMFLRSTTDRGVLEDIARRNRGNALGILKSLSDKDTPQLYETCIMSWGQFGRVVPDEELNLVLAKLIDFLGHRNQIISAFAVNEILNLASSRNQTPRRLFSRFWKSLGFFVVKDVVSRPQTARAVADLLQMTVSELVLLLQRYSLPWLVLTKRRDIIQRIAECRGEKDAWRPCLDSANLSSILSLLFVQEVSPDEIEHFVMSLLKNVSPHFIGLSLVDLLQAETVQVILELLKAAGESDERRKSRIRSVLRVIAGLLQPENKKDVEKDNLVESLFAEHALGLTARLAESINDNKASQPSVQEQRACIRAMEEMIRLCGPHMSTARPQMSAFLLTALTYDELRSASFSCWVTMLTHLEGDVDALIDTTFFIVGNYWNSFDSATRTACHAQLWTLLDQHKSVLEERINKLPSFSLIPDLADVEKKLRALRGPVDNRDSFVLFVGRIEHENSGVVLQGLTELAAYLRDHQAYLQTSAISEQPDSVVTNLARALLDCSAKYNGIHHDISRLCVDCIGLIGCLDSNRLDTVREQQHFVVVDNFNDAQETTDFVLFILEHVLVKSFLSTTDPNFLGFLSYVIQELLLRCDFTGAVAAKEGSDRDAPQADRIYRKWLALPDSVRNVLTPFLKSRYRVQPIPPPSLEYPVFHPGKGYGAWLRSFVVDLLHKGRNPFAVLVFEPLSRAIKVKDLAIAEFLLPYLVIHVVIEDEGSDADQKNAVGEILGILQYQLTNDASYAERENRKLYCEAVFRILDYAMSWLQKKKSQTGLDSKDEKSIKRVEDVLAAIPADLISRRAVDCRQYARALFHLEPHIQPHIHGRKDLEPKDPEEKRRLMSELQYFYSQIDEPDGLEGISASVAVLDLNQQILGHQKAGRWTAAQTWYEIRLAEEPENVDVQLDLLTCLKESGQHGKNYMPSILPRILTDRIDVLLNHVEGMDTTSATINRIAPFAVEASWATGRWQTLQKYLSLYNAGDITEVFNLGIAQALLCLRKGEADSFAAQIHLLRDKIASSMSYSATSSLQACHDAMLKAHVLSDLEIIAGSYNGKVTDRQHTLAVLNRRLEVIGAYVNDKQYVLGIRRAAMEIMRPKFEDGDISSLWLSSARLARKAGAIQQSFNAVLHAYRLGDGSATIDNARLLWKEGQHRKAIQMLRGAMENDSFIGHSLSSMAPTSSKNPNSARNLLTARAHLLLAKWLDSAGQTHASALRIQYQQAAKTHGQWEKGHYYLGRHYKKVLESEKVLKPDDQSDEFLSGETAKLVIENYIRSLNWGTKYLYQTLPRILTLWLELGAQVDQAPAGKVSVSRALYDRRSKVLVQLHTVLQKNLARLPAYIFYTAMAQLVARIAHPNAAVFTVLQSIIIKVVENHPRQALWRLFGIMTTKQQSERRSRGMQVLTTLRGASRKGDGELGKLIRMGEKLAEQLLMACNNGDFQSNRTTVASITRDLNFNHKCCPCPLVVPIETCLTATLPTLTDNVKKHKAFTRDLITIESFLDEVIVLGSLAKPRKLTARGSDGKLYGLLIKPKDDLRTDQRLMEFNGMINRSLKQDAESSRRQLYIRTYAVTPLNEECGIIEWVDGLKTLRDILLGLYKSRGVAPNYGQIQNMMKEAVTSDSNIKIFTEKVLGMFPPVLPLWFVAQFPNPSTWFAARLKYTRSCAVMSMVGTILGLGDRHGENVLLEEGNGGVFHVDFNCLFDKGLTFQQPERVPFRLTHNMVAAMGIYKYEGPFRRCSELTLTILRQQEETLMTILEAFIYDPTLDLQKDKKRKHEVVKLNPQSVVDSIKRKVRGLLPDESIPLGVEGQVEELIKQAVNPKNLSAMYIGWCPFL